ncbi:MAG TPA: HemD protein, partial [Nitrospiraceae bacterium]|nr:HemD protein [Nitrospiraceae bacterium]
DWSKLATCVDTLVILMAVKNLDMLVQKLMENGRSPDTPVAVVRWGTRPDQKTIVGNLGNIVGLVKDKEIKPPAVMVVGDVVKLRDQLQWYENKPMFGHRILITRKHSEGFEPLEELGADIIEFPTIEIVPPKDWNELDKAIDRIEAYDWLIFTSANGVTYFLKRFFEKAKDIRDLKGIKICAIGTKTEAVVKRYGMKVDLIPESFSAEGLIKLVQEFESSKVQGLKGLKFLLPRAEVAREIFPQKIRELGGEIDVVTAYRTIRPEKRGKRLKRFLREGKITAATFTSAATFNNFMDIFGEKAKELLHGATIAVIGPVTKKAVEKAGLSVDIMPEEATVEAMVEEIIKWAMGRKASVVSHK